MKKKLSLTLAILLVINGAAGIRSDIYAAEASVGDSGSPENEENEAPAEAAYEETVESVETAEYEDDGEFNDGEEISDRMIENETIEPETGAAEAALEMPDGYHDIEVELLGEEENSLFARAFLPSAYSSRGTYTSSVKDQDPSGSCWAFTWNAAGESSMLKKGISKQYDLSELQLAYAAYHTDPNPRSGLEGDKLTVAGNYLMAGGNHMLTTFISGAQYGAVDENDYPAVAWDKAATSYVMDDAYFYQRNSAYLQNCKWMKLSTASSEVKTAVMDYGAAATQMYYESGYYNSDEYAYYNDEKTNSNHAVTIVGWDDNFSRTKFDNTPAGDGAWLIKNSYGPSWGDGGYFWVSYYDASLSVAFVVDMDDETGDHLYQYDGGADPVNMVDKKYAANVFTAGGTEILRSVAFATRYMHVNYTIDIYRNVKTTPSTGKKIYTQSGSLDAAGFYTIPLDTPQYLASGEKFAVVVSMVSPSGSTCYVMADMDYQGGWFTCDSSSKSGQSYTSNDESSWTDVSAGGNCNVRIKALTDDTSAVPITKVALSAADITLGKGDSANLTCTYLPINTTDSLTAVWSSSNPSAVTVSADGKVTGVSFGSAVVTCKMGSVTASCTVSVEQIDIMKTFVFAVLDQTCTGRAITPDVQMTYGGKTLIKGTDYQLTYKDNCYAGTATITIRGIGKYTGTRSVTFRIKRAAGQRYDDVPADYSWRYNAAEYVTMHGIMNGISGTGRFNPDEPTTRAMFATIVYRMEGSPDIAYSGIFPDVRSGLYYSKPVIWANSKGIIRGHSNTGLFGPDECITREDMVTILFRYVQYRKMDNGARGDLGKFADRSKISQYAYEALSWAYANNIIKGRSNTGLLDPKGNATRIECAAVIQRFLEQNP